jgi:hypothetical protein
MAYKLLSNKDAVQKIIKALGLDEKHVKSVSINGKEIFNMDNMNEAVEVKIGKLLIDDQ